MAATDEELVRDAVAGSREAAAELFARHWPMAWRVAFTLTGTRAAAEDVAQDAFERAFSTLASFNGRSAFGTWLYRIVVNRALTVRAREHRLLAGEPLERVGPAPEQLELADAVAQLPADRRTVVALRYWLDFTPNEITVLLGLPAGTVNSRLARALAELRLTLEEDRDAD
ncbi:MAG: RNA polymerase sigma factor [Gaiellaceae bacterium]